MKKFKFTAEMFSRAELQAKFGDDAPWFYARIAEIANCELNNFGKEPENAEPHDMKAHDGKVVRETGIVEGCNRCLRLKLNLEVA